MEKGKGVGCFVRGKVQRESSRCVVQVQSVGCRVQRKGAGCEERCTVKGGQVFRTDFIN